MLIDKYELIKELKNSDIELTEDQLKELVDFITNFTEVEAVKCGADYWLDCYNFYTKTWTTEDGSFSRDSFIIERVDKNVHEND